MSHVLCLDQRRLSSKDISQTTLDNLDSMSADGENSAADAHPVNLGEISRVSPPWGGLLFICFSLKTGSEKVVKDQEKAWKDSEKAGKRQERQWNDSEKAVIALPPGGPRCLHSVCAQMATGAGGRQRPARSCKRSSHLRVHRANGTQAIA